MIWHNRINSCQLLNMSRFVLSFMKKYYEIWANNRRRTLAWLTWRRQQSYLAKIVLTMKNLYSMQNSTFEQKLQNGEWISPFRIFLKNKKMSHSKHEFNLNVAFWLTFPGLRRNPNFYKSKISSFNLMLHSLHFSQ